MLPKKVIEYLAQEDPKLAPLFDLELKYQLEGNGNHFEELAESIVSQQLSGKAADAIVSRVNILAKTKTFPSAKKILKLSDEDLRNCGLSYAKVSTKRSEERESSIERILDIALS